MIEYRMKQVYQVFIFWISKSDSKFSTLHVRSLYEKIESILIHVVSSNILILSICKKMNICFSNLVLYSCSCINILCFKPKYCSWVVYVLFLFSLVFVLRFSHIKVVHVGNYSVSDWTLQMFFLLWNNYKKHVNIHLHILKKIYDAVKTFDQIS